MQNCEKRVENCQVVSKILAVLDKDKYIEKQSEKISQAIRQTVLVLAALNSSFSLGARFHSFRILQRVF